MEKVEKFLGKYSVYLMLVFMILIFFNTCGTKSAIKSNSKRLDSLEQTIKIKDSLAIEIGLLEKEINNLELSKNVLFDWNSVVRTAVRPDDRMNEYDFRIGKLRKDLEALKNGKK